MESSEVAPDQICLEQLQKLIGSDVILMIGAPLSGKGTQSKLLSQTLNRPSVSTGDLFRAEIATGSILGQEMKSYMDKGELIPNDLTTQFLTDKLSDPIYKNGLILDGYPRNQSHLPIVKKILSKINRSIYAALYFDVPKSELEERRLTRSRADDEAQTFQHRYEVFQTETIPLIDELEQARILIRIECQSKTRENIHTNALSALLTHERQT